MFFSLDQSSPSWPLIPQGILGRKNMQVLEKSSYITRISNNLVSSHNDSTQLNFLFVLMKKFSFVL